MNISGQLEALLFVAGNEGISLEELSYLLNHSTASVYEAIEKLNKRYENEECSGLHILEVGNQFLLSTKKEAAELLKKYAQSPISNHLSQAALETLSIVAYKQPITRSEIDEVRGVQSSGSIQKLVVRQLIHEVGRVEGPGRAILYGTTEFFMNYFGLKDINELPSVTDMEEKLNEEEPMDLFFDRFKAVLGSVETTKTDPDSLKQAADENPAQETIDNDI